MQLAKRCARMQRPKLGFYLVGVSSGETERTFKPSLVFLGALYIILTITSSRKLTWVYFPEVESITLENVTFPRETSYLPR